MPSLEFNCLPHEIKALRKALGWTIHEFASVVEAGSDTTIKKWEHGRSKPLPIYRNKLRKLLEVCQPSYLMELEEHFRKAKDA